MPFLKVRRRKELSTFRRASAADRRNCWSRTGEEAFQPIASENCLIPSFRPRRKAWVWGYQLFGQLWKLTKGRLAQKTSTAERPSALSFLSAKLESESHRLQCRGIGLCFRSWYARAVMRHNTHPLISLKLKGWL